MRLILSLASTLRATPFLPRYEHMQSVGKATMSHETPIADRIKEILLSEFSPIHYEVINESDKHNVPKGSESHFKVLIVSEVFEGKNLVQRHRMVNHSLREELKSSVHALSIMAKTPQQWEQDPSQQKTPNCLGGDK